MASPDADNSDLDIDREQLELECRIWSGTTECIKVDGARAREVWAGLLATVQAWSPGDPDLAVLLPDSVSRLLDFGDQLLPHYIQARTTKDPAEALRWALGQEFDAWEAAHIWDFLSGFHDLMIEVPGMGDNWLHFFVGKAEVQLLEVIDLRLHQTALETFKVMPNIGSVVSVLGTDEYSIAVWAKLLSEGDEAGANYIREAAAGVLLKLSLAARTRWGQKKRIHGALSVLAQLPAFLTETSPDEPMAALQASWCATLGHRLSALAVEYNL